MLMQISEDGEFWHLREKEFCIRKTDFVHEAENMAISVKSQKPEILNQ